MIKTTNRGVPSGNVVVIIGGVMDAVNVMHIKKMLADQYIDDEEQKHIFLYEATQFKLWSNYIAALILTKQGKNAFHVSEIHNTLRKLLPQHYNKSGMKESGLLTQDTEINSHWHCGLPCLERIEGKRGWYRFIGYPGHKSER